ncbi:UNVERIFIED_CONTAM: hypothetical protein K2H54_069100 [Gekko kuhli]
MSLRSHAFSVSGVPNPSRDFWGRKDTPCLGVAPPVQSNGNGIEGLGKVITRVPVPVDTPTVVTGVEPPIGIGTVVTGGMVTGDLPQEVVEEAAGGPLVLISPAPETDAAEDLHPDPIQGLPGLRVSQRLDTLERGMAQLQVSVVQCEQQVATALQRTMELQRLLTEMRLDDAVREQRREELECRRCWMGQLPLPDLGGARDWRAGGKWGWGLGDGGDHRGGD